MFLRNLYSTLRRRDSEVKVDTWICDLFYLAFIACCPHILKFAISEFLIVLCIPNNLHLSIF